MFCPLRSYSKLKLLSVNKQIVLFSSTIANAEHEPDEFKALNLKFVRGQLRFPRRPIRENAVMPPRCEQMPTDQNWGNVWPGPKSFLPSTVPLPVRQGYVDNDAPPSKYGNAELMKIPNFLHLTPPVIKRQCEALKKFCTPWPKALTNEEDIQKHFPMKVASSTFCHSAPTIRNPLSRIVTVQLKLAALDLDEHAKDKFLRLVGERYCQETDILTVVADRCPLRKQNYDYAMYLITALYHESLNIEPWEKLKSEADIEIYRWDESASKKNVQKLFQTLESKEINIYSAAVTDLMNEGENEYTVSKYGEAVRKLLEISSLPT